MKQAHLKHIYYSFCSLLFLTGCTGQFSLLKMNQSSSSPTLTLKTQNNIVYTRMTSITLELDGDYSTTAEMAIFETDNCTGPEVWEPFLSQKTVSLSSGEGLKSFSAKVRDNSKISNCSHIEVILDQTAPTSISFEKVDGPNPTNNPIVSLTISATETSLPLEVAIDETNTCSSNIWQNTLVNIPYNLPAPTNNFTGIKSIYYKLRDASGNETPCTRYDVLLDTEAPTLTLTIPAGPLNSTSGSNTVISGICSENGVNTIQLSATSSGGGTLVASAANCVAGSWSSTLNLSTLNEGTVSIHATHTDSATNSTTETETLVLDKTNPTLTITAPNADSFVNSTQKNSLSLSGLCSEDGSQNITLQITSAGGGNFSPISFDCSSGNYSEIVNLDSLTDGTLTLSLTIEDSASNSTTVNRSVFLDSTPPVLSSLMIANGASHTNNQLTNISTSTSGSPQELYLTETSSCITGGSWQNITAPTYNFDSTQGLRTIYGKVRDSAGNESSCISDNITLDTIAPSGTLSINAGDDETNSLTVMTSLTASADVIEMALKEGNCPLSSPIYQSYSAENSLVLSEFSNSSVTSEIRYVSAMLKDNAGNVSCVSDVDGISLLNARNFISFRNTGFRVLDNIGTVSIPIYLRDYIGTTPRSSNNPIEVEYSIASEGTITKGNVSLTSGDLDSQENIVVPIPDVTSESVLKINLHSSDNKSVPLHSLTQFQLSVVDSASTNLPIGVIASSGDHNCAIKGSSALLSTGSFGTLFCWGEGSSKQIDGNVGDRYSPLAIDSANNYVDVATNINHTCGILSAGSPNLKCWGANDVGQLGKGNTDVTPPTGLHSVTNPTNSDWIWITTGKNHSCAIDSTGKLYCWGDDTYGQLGNGATTGVQTSPVEVDSSIVSNSWVQVSAFEDHTCALNSNKYIYCWGYNSNGQANPQNVGVNPSIPTRITLPGVNAVSNPDLKVATVHRVWNKERRIATGGAHSCAISSHVTADNADTNDRGRLYCWGKNLNNQVGNSATTSDVTTPYRVASTSYFSVANGYNNTCAITFSASITSRTLRCFGSSDYGKIGYGGTSDIGVTIIDRDVKNTAVTNIAYNFIALGRDHSCAIATATARDSDDGSPLAHYSVRCAGYNRSGQLGNGEISDVSVPTALDNFSAGSGGPRRFTTVSYGYRNGCAIDTSGSLYCWGSASNKTIGDGITSSTGAPFSFQRSTPTKIEHNTQFSRVAVGTKQACAITNSGRLKCWGENSLGQIGIGNSDFASPISINPSTTYAEVSAGDSHLCAITTSGALHCWGENPSGQLGDGTNLQRNTPTLIDSGISFIKVSAGYSHTCAITTANKLKCWGSSAYGQLGTGNTSSQLIPVSIDPANDYIDVKASVTHTCAIRKVSTNSGHVLCWGNNIYGQIGNNSMIGPVLTPVKIANSAGTDISDEFIKVSAGDNHSCAIRTDGTLFCWGYNTAGQLGDATKITRINPNPSSILASTDITAGGDSSCAIEQSTNILKCWGYDEFGNIGRGQKTLFFNFVPGI